MANKDGVQQMVHALFVRRAMAAHARSVGVADDPQVPPPRASLQTR
ncbi:hypothetical protein [Comamonas sp. JC664]